ncbi:MAG: AbrB/MazE/SpoVT family DNA-binding domain-containing protein [Chloroflexota bacterium]|jgi:antitoxin PrlF|nr:AbrB/MazE/SpoVT family DNA-binding domain-containing protein [Chloroflexota bacterium]
MVRARITSKGQVTLPVEVRRRYKLEAGDEIAFQMEDGGLRILPLKKRRLTEFRGMFPATKPYIGVEATRNEIARQLGEELERKIRKR